ncbi:MAG: cytochrome d ubiquinol oxidase subunit II [Candidatus Limnocylindrales bacterium]|jgi:cytochrome d ubiquinol oxidase subunit II
MPELSTVWFVLLGVLLTGYALLDGFDLGAGIVHLFVARTDLERRHVLNSIGPVWDGNEVWLITAGGALFAAFPIVYATVFSGFYLAMMLVLGALILRGISIEYRGKETATWWRTGWDAGFFLGSALVALLLGVALGNLLNGVALGADGVYRGGFVGLLNPFSLVVGVLTLALAAQQGSAWLVLKTEGEMAERARRAQMAAQVVVVLAWLGATALAFAGSLPAIDNFKANLAAWVGPVLVVNAIFFGFRATFMDQALRAFVCSSLTIAFMAITAATALYPNLVPAVVRARSLTVDNAHSSTLTMQVMLVVAVIGMPIVLAYTSYIYWKFKGKVRLDEASY